MTQNKCFRFYYLIKFCKDAFVMLRPLAVTVFIDGTVLASAFTASVNGLLTLQGTRCPKQRASGPRVMVWSLIFQDLRVLYESWWFVDRPHVFPLFVCVCSLQDVPASYWHTEHGRVPQLLGISCSMDMPVDNNNFQKFGTKFDVLCGHSNARMTLLKRNTSLFQA